MKRLISLLLALLLLAVPALAETHEPHVFEPEGLGIALTMDDSWYHELANNLYVTADCASSDPCEYSDLFFIYVDETYPDGVLLFGLSNRLEGSEHVPATHTFAPFTLSQPLFSENGRELIFWHSEAETLPAELSATLLLPIERILANPGDVTISEPVPMPDPAGFEAMHGMNVLDFSPVAADVLSGKKLTMINVWATYCNPCISEMPELAKLHADYADKGFQIIGIVLDAGNAEAYSEESRAFAQQIIESTGANYLHILPSRELMVGALNDITAVPTTFFLDEDGHILRTEVGGRNYAGWAVIVDELLESLQ